MRLTARTKATAAVLALCGAAGLAFCASVHAAEEPPHPASLDDAIIAAAKRHGVPEHLVRRIIMRESKYNPKARNHSFWGLMQISYPTAKSMGFKGTREELLNPVVNLRYAVPYLANAFVIAGKHEDAAVRLYAAGYYFTARSRGLLSELRTADSIPLSGLPDDAPVLAANAVAQPPQSFGIFGALFGPGQTPPPQPTQVAAYAADPSLAGQQALVTAPQASQQEAPQVSQQAPQASPQAPQASPQAPQQAGAAAPAGTFDGASIAMVASKTGDLAPPKKWTHDGGVTLMSRGEQGLDQVADRSHAPDETPRKSARHHPAKITILADLDLPPSTAQAYAGTGGPDPRFAAADSQAAIAQATSGQQPTGQPVGATVQQASAAPVDTLADEPADKPVKRSRVRQAKHHKSSGERTQLAQKPDDVPAQAAPAAPVAQ